MSQRTNTLAQSVTGDTPRDERTVPGHTHISNRKKKKGTIQTPKPDKNLSHITLLSTVNSSEKSLIFFLFSAIVLFAFGKFRYIRARFAKAKIAKQTGSPKVLVKDWMVASSARRSKLFSCIISGIG